MPTISSPSSTLTWKVGDLINFSGSATDPQDGTLPASALSWSLILHHCDPPTQTCHIHDLQTFNGVSSGSFNAPDHGYPSYLELLLTATDSQGLSTTTSVSLQPQTVNLTFASVAAGPPGRLRRLRRRPTPYTFDRDHRLDAFDQRAGDADAGRRRSTRSRRGRTAGAATHNITAPATATMYTATYTGWRAVEHSADRGRHGVADVGDGAVDGELRRVGLVGSGCGRHDLVLVGSERRRDVR